MLFAKRSPEFTKPYPTADHSNQFGESEVNLKIGLLRLFCLITTGVGLVAIIGSIVNFVVGHEFLPATWLGEITATSVALLSYGLTKAGHHLTAGWLLILVLFMAIGASYAQRGPGTLPLMLLLLPIVMAAVLLDTRAVLILTGLCIGFNLLLHWLESVAKWYAPPVPFDKDSIIIFDLFITLGAIPGLIALIVLPFRAQTRLLRRQNQRLTQALEALEIRQKQSQLASQKILELSTSLSNNATQQSASSQEQVTMIAQINSSISEISASVSGISEMAQNISSAMETMAISSQQIETTTQRSTQQSRLGSRAIAQTILESQQVAELYQKLTHTLEELNTKSADSRRILGLMASIAGETHLLALNAAIEAAGTGELGARFKVVAQEVKQLANQAGQAGQEVVQVIEQIRAAIEQAVKAVQEGYTKANNLFQVVGEAGKVIEQMQQIVQEAQSQANQVNQATREVIALVEQIKQATLQQDSANHQMLQVVPGLSAVAAQNAQDSAYISSAAQNLEEMSHNLAAMLFLNK
jgi:methyl-accepting chemotaxis protein